MATPLSPAPAEETDMARPTVSAKVAEIARPSAITGSEKPRAAKGIVRNAVRTR
ncbi:MAG: hypothetical protein GTN83_15085 [Acidobacteria bacterium]|nr:hypothetical protein [Acidobacteriota bacterium]